MAKKDENKDKDRKVAYFKPPVTCEDYKKMVNDFPLQLFGRPTTMTNAELRTEWDLAQKKENHPRVVRLRSKFRPDGVKRSRRTMI